MHAYKRNDQSRVVSFRREEARYLTSEGVETESPTFRKKLRFGVRHERIPLVRGSADFQHDGPPHTAFTVCARAGDANELLEGWSPSNVLPVIY